MSKKLYAVPEFEWEAEGNSRHDGYYIFESLEEARETSLYRSANGGSQYYYLGPERPLHAFPFILKDSITVKQFKTRQKTKNNKAIAFYDDFQKFAELVGKSVCL